MEIPLGKKDLYCNFTSFHFIMKISLHFDNPMSKSTIKTIPCAKQLKDESCSHYWVVKLSLKALDVF